MLNTQLFIHLRQGDKHLKILSSLEVITTHHQPLEILFTLNSPIAYHKQLGYLIYPLMALRQPHLHNWLAMPITTLQPIAQLHYTMLPINLISIALQALLLPPPPYCFLLADHNLQAPAPTQGLSLQCLLL